jgi:hypothetical protein
MTEAEWLACESPKEMFYCLRGQHGANRRKVGRRKLRLFGCASCWLFGDALDPRSRAAIEYMERFADGEVDKTPMEAVKEAARLAVLDADKLPAPPGLKWNESPERRASEAVFTLVSERPDSCAYAHWAMRSYIGKGASQESAARHQLWLDQLRTMARLMHDIFGNPFREVKFNKLWRTDTVLTLARQMYASREFSAMPILADALQDAGCTNEGILSHCRDANQIHVRGCWVVDLVLDKK